MRNKEIDTYMEQRFGKPNFKKSFRFGNNILTPMGDKYRLWRVDPLPHSRQ